MDKGSLRREIRRRILAMTPDEKAQASARVCRRALAHPRMQAAQTIGLYLPLPDEVDTSPILTALREQGRRVAVPCRADGVRVSEWAFRALSDYRNLRPGAWGIPEPTDGELLSVAALDLVVVPGRAFSPEGHRLGRGAGIYDRLLCGSRAYRLGLGFSCQRVPVLPVEAHDQRVDCVLFPD